MSAERGDANCGRASALFPQMSMPYRRVHDSADRAWRTLKKSSEEALGSGAAAPVAASQFGSWRGLPWGSFWEPCLVTPAPDW
jgi:hypothetical protein